MKKKYIRVIIILAITYLAVGVFVYTEGLRAQMQLHICPPGVFPEQGALQECARQKIDIKRELTTAPTVIIGWLPLIAGKLYSERSTETARNSVPDVLSDTKEIPGLGVFHNSTIENGFKTFTTETFGISFRYPAHYALFENESTYGDGTSSYHYLAMMPEESVRHIIENKLETEWPPGFGFAFYQKPGDFTTLEEWIRTHRESNFINEEWADTTLTIIAVAEVPALRYRVEGLYSYEYAAFAHEGYIVLVSLARETGENFTALLGSIKLK
ncbi:MAG: hypothetical protein NUV53_02985 [Patescibacteria group bacterium]|nr:hypothetical protein [Patescibacteria group bacterium]